MKRASLLGFLLAVALVPFAWSAKDVNVMDDIGFDKAFGYYSSGNETINMQTGNMIMSIPVSPRYPGPEGSGLDLQLKAIYNSSSWRYKANEREDLWDGEGATVQRNALVDINSMYFSPLGFGWRLHMGRLFRLFRDTPSCTSVQYVYEDPSGATHEFGPYCDDNSDLGQSPNGVFWALDGSNLMLQVQGFDTDNQKIIIFDPSGISYHFDSKVLRAPALTNRCTGFCEVMTTSDQVINVVQIMSYNKKASINITYHSEIESSENLCMLFYGHVIDKITDAFGRELDFLHTDVEYQFGNYTVMFPKYTGINVPVFAGTAQYVFDIDENVAIAEPWGEAHWRTDEHDPDESESQYCTSNNVLTHQLQLTKIQVPGNYSHEFDYVSQYSSVNNGEIARYKAPLGSETFYIFRNLIHKMSGTILLDTKYYQRSQPSRFINRKIVTNGINQWAWEYDLSWHAPSNIGNLPDYSIGDVINDSGSTSYGSTIGLTRVLDPDLNETVYLWKNASFYCCPDEFCSEPERDYHKPGIPCVGDCPVLDNSYNGRLTNMLYYDGFAKDGKLKKEEIFNLEYDEQHEDWPGDPENPWYGDGMGDHCFMPCKDNLHEFKQNIRDVFKETRFYDDNGEFIVNREKTEYSTHETSPGFSRKFYVVSKRISSASNLPVIETVYQYNNLAGCCSIDQNDPTNTLYKTDFVDSVIVKEDNQIVSKTDYVRDGNDPGRIGEKKMYTGDGQVIVIDYDYGGSYLEMEKETWLGALPGSGEGDEKNNLVYNYEYSGGTLKNKWIGNHVLYLIRNKIDFNSGLVMTSTDSADNTTSYEYDALSRMTKITPPSQNDPAVDRFITKIDYDKDANKTIQYSRINSAGFERIYKSYTLDNMGNVAWAEELVFDENGYTMIPTGNSEFDWRGNTTKAIYPGNPDTFYRTDYDYQGRPVEITQCHLNENNEPQTDSVRTIGYFVKTDMGMFEKIDTDNVGKSRMYYTDLRGNLRKVETGLFSGNAVYNYDALGNLIQVDHGATVRNYAYDWLSRMKESHEPETGSRYFWYYNDGKIGAESSTNSFLTDGTKYFEYNTTNKLASVYHQINGNLKCVRTMNYDETKVELTDGSGVTVTAAIRNGKGKLTSRKDWSYMSGDELDPDETHQAWSYNDFGDVTDEWFQADVEGFNSEVFRTSYRYNRWGNLSNLTYPSSGLTVNYLGYNPSDSSQKEGNMITGVTLDDPTYPGGVRTIAKGVIYSPIGNPKLLIYDNNAWLGLIPDKRNRFAGNAALDKDDNWYFLDAYWYNEVNQITKISNEKSENVTDYLEFQYLSDGSLNTVTDEAGSVKVSYQYDMQGNMRSRLVDNGNSSIMNFENVIYTSQNRIDPSNEFTKGSGSFAYDSNGNVTYNPITENHYHFDFDNRLSQITKKNGSIKKFVYDADKKRRLMKEDGVYEMFFYDQTGNNILEKLRYTVDENNKAKLVKDECFINLGKNNIAQLDFFEPVVSTVLQEENPEKTVFGPGDEMDVKVKIDYQGDPIDVDLYTFLYFNEAFWFFPSWESTPDCKRIKLKQSLQEEDIINFTFGKSLDNCGPLYFVSGLIVPGDKPQLFGNMAFKEFFLSEERQMAPEGHMLYVRPGSVFGNGGIGSPYNSIQEAVDFAILQNPDETNRFTIKLFPGNYQLASGEAIIIDHPGIDLIGSGQNKTKISGLSPWNSIILDNGADAVIQSIRLECNVVCDNGASPFFRNVRILNNGSLAGIIATNGCELTVVNCLIADYFAGIALNNSACTVRSSTIDSCWGPLSPDDLPPDWPADWPVDFAGGGIIASRGEFYEGNTDIRVEESIITNNETGIDVSGFITVEVDRCNLWNNDINFYGDQATFIQSSNMFQNPRFVTGNDHAYYLSCVGAGQSVNSPCIDAGNPSRPVHKMINGSTRTDGLFDICAPDIGYHGRLNGSIIGIGNINNDTYELDDPRTTLARADKTTVTDKKQTTRDVSSIFSLGPKDVVVLKENSNGIVEFQTYFQDACSLHQQINPNSPTNIIDAALSDMDGDGVPDLVVLEESGPKIFVNDTYGSLSLEATKPVLQSKAIAVLDVNRDGYKDLLVGTSGGVTVQMADTHLSWSSSQLIPSGDTENLLLHDFDNDGFSDLITIDRNGVVRFYKNRRTLGFIEVGNPVQVHGYGKMMVQDADNDGQMDVVVEIASGVNEVVAIGSIFGVQPIPPGGKRGVRYVLFDHLGSARMLINDECDVVWPNYGIMEVNKLLPFGQEEEKVQLNSSEISYNLNFTNKELDRDLELNYFSARYYHPELPRFISPDPVGGKPATPLSWNRYLYCRNDPINLVDPDGEFAFLAMLAAAGASALFAEIANAPATEAESIPAQGPLVTVLGPACVGAAVEQLGVSGAISAAEHLLPDAAWQQNAPHQVVPGTKTLEHEKLNLKTGEIEDSSVKYDDYGRQIERADHTNHGYGDPESPDYHSNPHKHTYEYGPGYGPKGKETITNLIQDENSETN